MHRRTLVSLGATLAAFALGCTRHWPEGVYPCSQDRDCPPAWLCHSDSLCYSRPEPDSGSSDTGPPPDAAVVDGGTTPLDAWARDAPICVPTLEVCNGVDDDCDTAIDEDLAVVGSPVSFSTDGYGPHLVGVRAGFVAMWISGDPNERWRNLDASGIPFGTGDGTRLPAREYLDLAFDGTNVLVAGGTLSGFTASAGAPIWLPGPRAGLIDGATPQSVRALDLTSAAAPAWELVDTTTDPPSVMARRTTGAIQFDFGNADLIHAGAWDVVLHGSDGALVIERVASDGSSFENLGILAPRPTTPLTNYWVLVAGAIATPSHDVTADNPLAVAYMLGESNAGGNVTHLAIVTSLSPLTFETRDLQGSFGPPDFGGYYHQQDFLRVVPVPGATPMQWYVVATEPDHPGDASYFATVRAWEISASHPDGRPLTIPAVERTRITGIATATSGNAVRFAGNTSSGLASWSIGCGQ